MRNRTRHIGWLMAALALTGGAVGLVVHYRGGDARATHSVTEEGMTSATCVNADELEQLKNAVRALDRKSTALELQLVAQTQLVTRVPAAAATTEPSAAKIQDNRTEAEIRKSALASLDAALIADRGDMRDNAAASKTLSRDLTEAAGGNARIASVQCGSVFCKAVLEEDTASGQRVDMNAILTLPILKTEAVFDYRTEGSRKFTTMYAAREGFTLPPPPAPIPEVPRDSGRSANH